MSDLIAVVLPVFGLIAIGFIAGWSRLLPDRAGDGLSDYVFTLGIPVLIFKTMVNAKLPDAQPWGYWAAYFGGVAVVWILAMWIGQKYFALNHRQSVVAGFSAGQSNTVLVGIPLLLKAYGDPGAVPLFLLVAVHLPVTMTTATLLFEGMNLKSLWRLLPRLVFHPILLGLLAGLVYRFSGLPLGGPFKTIVENLAASALPCALVAMGMALRRYGLEANLRLTAVISALKLILHPAIVFILGFKILHLPEVWAGVAVLFAAAPTGINCYLFAARYKTGEAMASSAIAVTTVLSLFSTLFWLWMLGIEHL